MSTFPGRMLEYSNISIDRFDGPNLQSTAYFLSHNHCDHTRGLDSTNFAYRIDSNKHMKIFCSEVTRDLLLVEDKYKHLQRSLVTLTIGCPTSVAIPDPITGLVQQTVTVTLLHAGHCPGSVMFLFEGREGAVLYTGDFRLEQREFMEMPELKSGTGPKELQSIYIDTTFCVPEAFFIPTREQSAQVVLDIAREWICQSPHHMIVLHHKANLGYEYLYRKLCQAFAMKVHVDASRYRNYELVGDMTNLTTADPGATQIHACSRMAYQRNKRSQLPCGYLPTTNIHVRVIAVSTMCFIKNVTTDVWAKRHNDNYYRVCYSFHCSYSEVRDVLLYLKPKRVYPNVVPEYPTKYSLKQMQDRVDSFLKLGQQNKLHLSPSEPRALGKLKRKKRKRQQLSQHSANSDQLDFGDLDEEPRSKTQRLQSPAKQEESGQEQAKVEDMLGEDLKLTDGGRLESLEFESDSGNSSDDESSFDLFGDDEDLTKYIPGEDLEILSQFKCSKIEGDSYSEHLTYLSDDDDIDVVSQAFLSPQKGDSSVGLEQLQAVKIAAESDNSSNYTTQSDFLSLRKIDSAKGESNTEILCKSTANRGVESQVTSEAMSVMHSEKDETAGKNNHNTATKLGEAQEGNSQVARDGHNENPMQYALSSPQQGDSVDITSGEGEVKPLQCSSSKIQQADNGATRFEDTEKQEQYARSDTQQENSNVTHIENTAKQEQYTRSETQQDNSNVTHIENTGKPKHYTSSETQQGNSKFTGIGGSMKPMLYSADTGRPGVEKNTVNIGNSTSLNSVVASPLSQTKLKAPVSKRKKSYGPLSKTKAYRTSEETVEEEHITLSDDDCIEIIEEASQSLLASDKSFPTCLLPGAPINVPSRTNMSGINRPVNRDLLIAQTSRGICNMANVHASVNSPDQLVRLQQLSNNMLPASVPYMTSNMPVQPYQPSQKKRRRPKKQTQLDIYGATQPLRLSNPDLGLGKMQNVTTMEQQFLSHTLQPTHVVNQPPAKRRRPPKKKSETLNFPLSNVGIDQVQYSQGGLPAPKSVEHLGLPGITQGSVDYNISPAKKRRPPKQQKVMDNVPLSNVCIDQVQCSKDLAGLTPDFIDHNVPPAKKRRPPTKKKVMDNVPLSNVGIDQVQCTENLSAPDFIEHNIPPAKKRRPPVKKKVMDVPLSNVGIHHVQYSEGKLAAKPMEQLVSSGITPSSINHNLPPVKKRRPPRKKKIIDNVPLSNVSTDQVSTQQVKMSLTSKANGLEVGPAVNSLNNVINETMATAEDKNIDSSGVPSVFQQLEKCSEKKSAIDTVSNLNFPGASLSDGKELSTLIPSNPSCTGTNIRPIESTFLTDGCINLAGGKLQDILQAEKAICMSGNFSAPKPKKPRSPRKKKQVDNSQSLDSLTITNVTKDNVDQAKISPAEEHLEGSVISVASPACNPVVVMPTKKPRAPRKKKTGISSDLQSFPMSNVGDVQRETVSSTHTNPMAIGHSLLGDMPGTHEPNLPPVKKRRSPKKKTIVANPSNIESSCMSVVGGDQELNPSVISATPVAMTSVLSSGMPHELSIPPVKKRRPPKKKTIAANPLNIESLCMPVVGGQQELNPTGISATPVAMTSVLSSGMPHELIIPPVKKRRPPKKKTIAANPSNIESLCMPVVGGQQELNPTGISATPVAMTSVLSSGMPHELIIPPVKKRRPPKKKTIAANPSNIESLCMPVVGGHKELNPTGISATPVAMTSVLSSGMPHELSIPPVKKRRPPKKKTIVANPTNIESLCMPVVGEDQELNPTGISATPVVMTSVLSSGMPHELSTPPVKKRRPPKKKTIVANPSNIESSQLVSGGMLGFNQVNSQSVKKPRTPRKKPENPLMVGGFSTVPNETLKQIPDGTINSSDPPVLVAGNEISPEIPKYLGEEQRQPVPGIPGTTSASDMPSGTGLFEGEPVPGEKQDKIEFISQGASSMSSTITGQKRPKKPRGPRKKKPVEMTQNFNNSSLLGLTTEDNSSPMTLPGKTSDASMIPVALSTANQTGQQPAKKRRAPRKKKLTDASSGLISASGACSLASAFSGDAQQQEMRSLSAALPVEALKHLDHDPLMPKRHSEGASDPAGFTGLNILTKQPVKKRRPPKKKKPINFLEGEVFHGSMHGDKHMLCEPGIPANISAITQVSALQTIGPCVKKRRTPAKKKLAQTSGLGTEFPDEILSHSEEALTLSQGAVCPSRTIVPSRSYSDSELLGDSDLMLSDEDTDELMGRLVSPLQSSGPCIQPAKKRKAPIKRKRKNKFQGVLDDTAAQCIMSAKTDITGQTQSHLANSSKPPPREQQVAKKKQTGTSVLDFPSPDKLSPGAISPSEMTTPDFAKKPMNFPGSPDSECDYTESDSESMCSDEESDEESERQTALKFAGAPAASYICSRSKRTGRILEEGEICSDMELEILSSEDESRLYDSEFEEDIDSEDMMDSEFDRSDFSELDESTDLDIPRKEISLSQSSEKNLCEKNSIRKKSNEKTVERKSDEPTPGKNKSGNKTCVERASGEKGSGEKTSTSRTNVGLETGHPKTPDIDQQNRRVEQIDLTEDDNDVEISAGPSTGTCCNSNIRSTSLGRWNPGSGIMPLFVIQPHSNMGCLTCPEHLRRRLIDISNKKEDCIVIDDDSDLEMLDEEPLNARKTSSTEPRPKPVHDNDVEGYQNNADRSSSQRSRSSNSTDSTINEGKKLHSDQRSRSTSEEPNSTQTIRDSDKLDRDLEKELAQDSLLEKNNGTTEIEHSEVSKNIVHEKSPSLEALSHSATQNSHSRSSDIETDLPSKEKAVEIGDNCTCATVDGRYTCSSEKSSRLEPVDLSSDKTALDKNKPVQGNDTNTCETHDIHIAKKVDGFQKQVEATEPHSTIKIKSVEINDDCLCATQRRVSVSSEDPSNLELIDLENDKDCSPDKDRSAKNVNNTTCETQDICITKTVSGMQKELGANTGPLRKVKPIEINDEYCSSHSVVSHRAEDKLQTEPIDLDKTGDSLERDNSADEDIDDDETQDIHTTKTACSLEKQLEIIVTRSPPKVKHIEKDNEYSCAMQGAFISSSGKGTIDLENDKPGASFDKDRTAECGNDTCSETQDLRITKTVSGLQKQLEAAETRSSRKPIEIDDECSRDTKRRKCFGSEDTSIIEPIDLENVREGSISHKDHHAAYDDDDSMDHQDVCITKTVSGLQKQYVAIVVDDDRVITRMNRNICTCNRVPFRRENQAHEPIELLDDNDSANETDDLYISKTKLCVHDESLIDLDVDDSAIDLDTEKTESTKVCVIPESTKPRTEMTGQEVLSLSHLQKVPECNTGTVSLNEPLHIDGGTANDTLHENTVKKSSHNEHESGPDNLCDSNDEQNVSRGIQERVASEDSSLNDCHDKVTHSPDKSRIKIDFSPKNITESTQSNDFSSSINSSLLRSDEVNFSAENTSKEIDDSDAPQGDFLLKSSDSHQTDSPICGADSLADCDDVDAELLESNLNVQNLEACNIPSDVIATLSETKAAVSVSDDGRLVAAVRAACNMSPVAGPIIPQTARGDGECDDMTIASSENVEFANQECDIKNDCSCNTTNTTSVDDCVQRTPLNSENRNCDDNADIERNSAVSHPHSAIIGSVESDTVCESQVPSETDSCGLEMKTGEAHSICPLASPSRMPAECSSPNAPDVPSGDTTDELSPAIPLLATFTST